MIDSEEPRIRRAFVTVGDRQVHFRYAGKGPAVILFGQSPTSSQTLDRQTRAFAKHFTAIAIDTAGLGRSTALKTPYPEIADQAIALAETLDALGISKAAVYGSHTGASICVEFAMRYPERTAIALLDGYPIYPEAERVRRLNTYFPSFEPTWDGLHLMWLWYRYREQNLFWPWNIRSRVTRANCSMPEALHLHRGVVDILEVGMGYVQPYAAAFRYRAEQPIPHLKVPVVFVAYPDDSLFSSLELLPELPNCCRIEDMPLDRDLGALKEIELMKSVPVWPDAPPVSGPDRLATGVTRDYVDCDGGQLFLRRWGGGSKRPLLMLPPAPGSATQLDTIPELLAVDREVIAVDLPGCGDSDSYLSADRSVEWMAGLVRGAAAHLGLGRFDLFARHGGGAVAAELVKISDKSIVRILLDSPPALSGRDREAIAPRYGQPIEISEDGSHLIRLWHAARDQELFWPWYDRTIGRIRANEPDVNPERLTCEVHAYLKNYETYADTWCTTLSYPLADELERLGRRVSYFGSENDKFFAHAEKVSGGRIARLPDSRLAAASILAAELDRAD